MSMTLSQANDIHSDDIVVLLENDPDYAAELVEFLQTHGLTVHWLRQIDDLLAQIDEIRPGIIVMDQFLDQCDALTFIPALRATFDGGLLVLTGNINPVDRVVALEGGADDYVRKSDGPRELLARMRAVGRRTNPRRGALRTDCVQDDTRWTLNYDREFILTPTGGPVKLTRAEFIVLATLIESAPQPVDRQTLSVAALRRDWLVEDRSIDVVVHGLRKRLAPYKDCSGLIQTARGIGYMITQPQMFNMVGAKHF